MIEGPRRLQEHNNCGTKFFTNLVMISRPNQYAGPVIVQDQKLVMIAGQNLIGTQKWVS